MPSGKSAILFFFMLMTGLCSYGEGSKQLMTDSVISQAGLYLDNQPYGDYTLFGIVNCAPNYRLYIHVKNPGESILFGLSGVSNYYTYNLRKPDGTIAMSGSIPNTPGQPGYIRYYSQASAGPFPANGGYTPLSYTVTSVADTGNYYFELSNTAQVSLVVNLWDFQVVSGQHTPAVAADMKNGRVWSQSWQVYADLNTNMMFNGRFYIYSDDGIVTRLAFSNARVGAVTIFCNPFGCLNTGNFDSDRQSKNTNTFTTFPAIAQYKVFLNNPDSTVYPSGVYGQVTSTPYMVPDPAYPPCSSHKNIIVDVNKSGQVSVVITMPYGAPATTVNFFANVVAGTNTIPWNGLDGLGNPVPDGTLINVSVTFVNGLTNLPVWDQEQNMDGFLIALIRPVNTSMMTPLTYWDDREITTTSICPVAPQAANLAGCSPGSIPGYTGCHPWGLNSGDCHDKMINTWWYGSTSTTAFTTLFTLGPAVPTGTGASRCGPGTLVLHATVQAPATADWYDVATGGSPLLSGDTVFTTPVLLNTTTYYAGSRNPASGCISSARVPVTATVLPVPVPSLSGPVLVCAGTTGNLYITDSGKLNYQWNVSAGGTITGGFGTSAITVAWNTGNGQSVSVNYTNPGGCAGITPSVIRVSVIPPPDTAGGISGTDSVCTGTTGIQYAVPHMASTTGYTWSVPAGVIITAGAGTNIITVDFPAGATSGNFMVYGSNPCGSGPPSPPFPVTVSLPPSASAGPDSTICENIPFTVLHATASGYSHIRWQAGGSGTLANATTLYPTYTPGPGETGSVVLSLTAYGISPCPGIVSEMTLHLVPSPSADAGPGILSCGLSPVILSGSAASGYLSLIWSTTGAGSFSDPAALHPVYTPGPQDLSAGRVYFTLAATGSPVCPVKTDSTTLSLGKHATADAGPDRTTCGATPLMISGSEAQNFSTLLWETSGNGTFSDIHVLHPIYTPGASDTGSGHSRLILHAFGQGACPQSDDTLVLSFAVPPSVQAGPDEATCQGSSMAIAGASALNYSSILWSSSGQGTLDGSNQLVPLYSPSPGETGRVTLTIRVAGTGSCSDDTVTGHTHLLIRQPVAADAGAGQTIPYGTATGLTGYASGGSGDYRYQWQPAALLTDPASQNPETLPLSLPVTFLLQVSDQATGCTGVDSVRVAVTAKPVPTEENCIIIHNVFTPNGDGINDTWIIDCIENFPLNKVIIFDRWGDKINEIENYNNTSAVWKGSNLQGKMVPDGTYYYLLSVTGGGSYSGWVLLRGGDK